MATLKTPAQRAQDKLLKDRNVDTLEAGGFRRRDEQRRAIKAETREKKKLNRAFNLAYREQLKRGNRGAALDILLKAQEHGASTGGIREAGSIEAGVIQEIGEANLTHQAAIEKDGRITEAPEAIADPPVPPQEFPDFEDLDEGQKFLSKELSEELDDDVTIKEAAKTISGRFFPTMGDIFPNIEQGDFSKSIFL